MRIVLGLLLLGLSGVWWSCGPGLPVSEEVRLERAGESTAEGSANDRQERVAEPSQDKTGEPVGEVPPDTRLADTPSDGGEIGREKREEPSSFPEESAPGDASEPVERVSEAGSDVGPEQDVGEPVAERPPEPVVEKGPPPKPWAIAVGKGANFIYSSQVAVDAQDNVYATGHFEGTMTVDGKTYTSNAVGGTDTFVMKLSPQGKLLWFLHITGKDSKRILGLATGASGAVYITGLFFGTVQLGAKTLDSAKGGGCFVARISSQGKVVWALQAGGSGADAGKALAIGPKGDLYLAGEFDGKATFGSIQLPDSRYSDVFVARLSPQGAFRWVATAKGASSGFAVSLAVNAQGDAYVVGQFFGSMKVGTTTLKAQQMDMMTAKVDSQGRWQWAIQSDGLGQTLSHAVCLDRAGHVYVTGESSGTKKFGSLTVKSPAHGDIFLVRVSSQGAFVWLSRTSGTAHVHPYAMAMDPKDRLFLAGDYNGEPSFGSFPLPKTQSFQTFAARATTQGFFAWASATQGSVNHDVNTRGLALDSYGGLVLVGDFTGVAQLNGITLNPGISQRYFFVWRRQRPP